jgi:hypothetical protein
MLTVLAYLRQVLGADFNKEYMKLSEADRSDLKAWAEAEMAA